MFSKRFLLVFFTIFLVTFLAACGNKDDSVIHMDPSDLRPVPTLEFAISDSEEPQKLDNTSYIPIIEKAPNTSAISFSVIEQIPEDLVSSEIIVISYYNPENNTIYYQGLYDNCGTEGGGQLFTLIYLVKGASNFAQAAEAVHESESKGVSAPPTQIIQSDC